MSDAIPSSSGANLACNIQDLEQQRQRSAEVQTLFRQATHRQELPDGYAFSFPSESQWAATLLEFILFEKNCCPFFTFELTFEANHGPLWLRLRGTEGVKAIINEDFLTSH